MIAHACNPSYQEAEAEESLERSVRGLGTEAAVSGDCTTVLQPGRQSKIPSQKKKKDRREKKKESFLIFPASMIEASKVDGLEMGVI